MKDEIININHNIIEHNKDKQTDIIIKFNKTKKDIKYGDTLKEVLYKINYRLKYSKEVKKELEDKIDSINDLESQIESLRDDYLNSLTLNPSPDHDTYLLQKEKILQDTLHGGGSKNNNLLPSWVNSCKPFQYDTNDFVDMMFSLPQPQQQSTDPASAPLPPTPTQSTQPKPPQPQQQQQQTTHSKPQQQTTQTELTLDQHLDIVRQLRNDKIKNFDIEYNDDLLKKPFVDLDELIQAIESYEIESVRPSIIEKYGDIKYWNTSKLGSFKQIFEYQKNFDYDISLWQTDNVKVLDSMFTNTNFINNQQDYNTKYVYINNIPSDKIEELKSKINIRQRNGKWLYNAWDMKSLESATSMFFSSNFNGFVGNWNPRNLKNVATMFSGCSEFNQPIYWGKTSLQDMTNMFMKASKFNNYISITDLEYTIILMDGRTSKTMDKVKQLLVSPVVRSHFDPKLPTILKCDAARRKGMGYALMQNHGEDYKLVAAECRWLLAAEQPYGMTSLELAGVYWAT